MIDLTRVDYFKFGAIYKWQWFKYTLFPTSQYDVRVRSSCCHDREAVEPGFLPPRLDWLRPAPPPPPPPISPPPCCPLPPPPLAYFRSRRFLSCSLSPRPGGPIPGSWWWRGRLSRSRERCDDFRWRRSPCWLLPGGPLLLKLNNCYSDEDDERIILWYEIESD